MAYIRKTWVNVPDPSNPPAIPEGQDSLARFDAENMNRIEAGIEEARSSVGAHTHSKEDIGLSNVDNTSDVNKPVSTAQATAIADAKKAGTSAQSNLNSHLNDTTKHITAAERNTWNGKANASHSHTKSQITDFPTSMPASDVYSWAKQSAKPTYIASEVGAATTFTRTVQTSTSNWVLLTNANAGSYRQEIACSGLLATDTPIVDVVTDTDEDLDLDANMLFFKAWSHIVRAKADNDKIFIYTDGTIPEVNFKLQVKVVR